MAFPQETVVLECPGPLVVHEDGVLECLDPDCTGFDPDGSGLDHDTLETSCWVVFEGDCPRCGPPPEGEPRRERSAVAGEAPGVSLSLVTREHGTGEHAARGLAR